MSDIATPFPDYPTKHKGVALVVGASSTALDDLSRAKEKLTEAPYVIAVNSMMNVVDCQAMVTCHSEFIPKFLKNLMRKSVPPIIHHYPTDQREKTALELFVDHVWFGPPAGSGTASLCAVMVAQAIGFRDIILCGVSLSNTGYSEGYDLMPYPAFLESEKLAVNTNVLQYRTAWGKFNKAGMLASVSSLAEGFTQNLLGKPDFEGLNNAIINTA